MTIIEGEALAFSCCAAMEPAEDRPDDLALVASIGPNAAAAMEPAEDRPDDHAIIEKKIINLDAAMEPAEDRPDDPAIRFDLSFLQESRNGAGRGSAG